MKTLPLGKDGPPISAIGLGCMGMSEFYGPSNDERSISVIHRALDLGINFFDSSDVYGIGKNEELLGRAFAGRREEAVIATKFGLVRGPDGSFSGFNGTPEYVQSACEASLRRLGIGTIDLYYQHRVDPDTPIEDTVGAMARLVEQGKVRQLGLSEASSEIIRRAHAVHPISALQSEYSLWSRDPEDGLLATCAELGITFVAFSPLGRGFLTGAIKDTGGLAENDLRRIVPRFQGENLKKNLSLVETIEARARDMGCTAAQLALAWLLSRDPPVVPIPGTRSIGRLEENAASVDIALTPQELERLDEAVPKGIAAGTRFPEIGTKPVKN